MSVNRRAFLTLAGTSLILPLIGQRSLHAAETSGDRLFASCVKLPDESYGVAVLSDDGAVRRLYPLPDRGHDIAYDPASRRAVAFARRPGTFAVVFDPEGRAEPTTISAAPGRHFFGHGVFSADGGLLYATENDFDAGRGVVGIYDTRDSYRRLGEFETGGLGPHELVWLGDGRTLAVANGGLDTSPDAGGGRLDLNRDSMRPSLVFIDAATQKISRRLDLGAGQEQLSIRHLAVDGEGALWFGCQFEGNPTDLPPLAGRVRDGRDPELFDLPADIRPRTRNYIGSVTATGDGSAVAFAAPHGGMIFAFAAGSAQFLGKIDLDDGCGLAPKDAGLLASAGTGTVGRLTTDSGLSYNPMTTDKVAFDNHLNRLI